MDQPDRLSTKEWWNLFLAMFPTGPAGPDVLLELAPDGWHQFPLLAIAHPSPATILAETSRLHENMNALTRPRPGETALPAPTMQEVMESYKPTPVDPEAECADIVARCLWDIFSDNHEVIAADGRIADIGSFRGAGGFIADWLNRTLDTGGYDYMDFYMGTIWVAERADLSPVYRMIFGRLKRLGMDWKYSFPRLGVVRFEKPPQDEAEVGYDPSVGFEKEQEKAKREEEFNEMQESLRDGYNESVRESRKQRPPTVVRAYMAVYGRMPEGWPPEEDLGWVEE